MAVSTILIVPPPFEDLSKVDFVEDEDYLHFKFVNSLSPDAVPCGTTLRGVIDTASQLFRTLSLNREVTAPMQAIQFPPNQELAETIKRLAGRVSLYKILLGRSPLIKSFEIPATNAVSFFEAISQLQEHNSRICVTPSDLHAAFDSLQSHGYMTIPDVKRLRTSIKTPLSLYEYKQEAKRTSDIGKAISLAFYYRNREDPWHDTAVDWLCYAEKFAHEHHKRLGNLMDLNRFALGLKCIEVSIVFHEDFEEVAEALATSPSITMIRPFRYAECTQDSAQRVGRLLARSNSIEEVDLSTDWGTDWSTSRLINTTVIPIANALEINRSVKIFRVCDTCIGDEGVMKLSKAIRKNPCSNVRLLDLSRCSITNESAQHIPEFLRQHEQITHVFVRGNKINSSHEDATNQAARANRIRLKRRMRQVLKGF